MVRGALVRGLQTVGGKQRPINPDLSAWIQYGLSDDELGRRIPHGSRERLAS